MKRKTAMKIRMQWKTYNWRTIQEACKAKNQFRVVALAHPCSNLWSFGSKCTALKKALVILLRLSVPPAVIRLPHSDSAPGELCPFPPSLRPCSAVGDSGVDLHDTRGVTRLDGVRGKNQIWRPHNWIWGLMEANLLYWRKYLWHCWKFSAPPQSFGAPIMISVPGELLPLAPACYVPEWYGSICEITISGWVYCRK